MMLLFQSYQSKQINPDLTSFDVKVWDGVRFQSYQSKQINPDYCKMYNG